MYLLPLNTGFTFPDDDVSQAEKSLPSYGVNVGRALYSRFCLGGTYGWGYEDIGSLMVTRNYGDGVQPEQLYRDWYTNGSPIGGGKGATNQGSNGQNSSRQSRLMTTAMRGALANISYKIYSPVPKFSGTIVSLLSENDYKVDCVSVEQDAVDKKTRRKMEILYASTIVNPLAKELGLPPISIPFAPQSEEELEMMEKRGMLKTDIERSLEQVIDTGFRLSDWQGTVRRKNNKDAIDFNFRCVKGYVEEGSGAVKVRYVDVTKLVMLWNDNDDSPVAIGDVRIVDIQSIYHKLVEAGFSHDEIKSIANTYKGQQIEAWQNDQNIFERKDPLTNKWTWLDFKVPVLEFDYLSTDYIQYAKGKDKKGKGFYEKNDPPVREKEKSKDRAYDDFKCNYWWEGSYIVGTDKGFGWRKKPNQAQKSKLNPMCSYIFDKAIDNGQALTQRVMGLADDLMFALLKKRAAVWASAPKGYDIDIGEGANIKIGGQEYSPFDLIHMHRQNGVKFKKTYMSATSGKVSGDAIKERDNGLGPQGQEWLNEMAACVYQIANVMGITDAMAAAPDLSAEKAVGVMDAEISATNHALWPIKESDRQFKAKIGQWLALQTRVEIMNNPRSKKFYENQLGNHIIGVLDSIDHMSLEGLGITMKALPTKKEKDLIMARAIEMSKIATRDGTTYLSPADVTEVGRYLNNDDPDGAIFFMTQREQFNRKEAERISTQAVEQTGQVQIQSAQAAEQAKQQTIGTQLQADLQKIQAEGNKEIMVLQKKYEFETPSKLAQIQAQGMVDDNLQTKEIIGEFAKQSEIKTKKAA